MKNVFLFLNLVCLYCNMYGQTFRTDTVMSSAGVTVNLPIKVSGYSEVLSEELRIIYNQDSLHFNGIVNVNANLPHNIWGIDTRIVDTLVIFRTDSLFQNKSIADDSVLYALQFIVHGESPVVIFSPQACTDSLLSLMVQQQGGYVLIDESIIDLPLDLLWFKAKCKDGVQVSFATTNEKDVAKIEILRSGSGYEPWEKIGEIEPNNNLSQTNIYTFLDKTHGANQEYYCLKSIDKDKSFKLSHIIFVDCNKQNTDMIYVYPNPISVGQNPKLSITYLGQINVVVRNYLGQVIYEKQLDGGQNTYSLPPLSVAGVYTAEIKTDAASSVFVEIIVN